MNLEQASLSEITKLWTRVLSYIKGTLNDDMLYDSFFKDLYVEKVENGAVTVVADSQLAVQLLSTQYTSLVEAALKDLADSKVKVNFVTKDDLKESSWSEETQKTPAFFSSSVLNEELTFENFVVGQFNREAYQAATLIATNPGRMYNPLFIYSPSGLGKTHLINAVGNHIVKNNARQRVLCISADAFVDEYVRFVRVDSDGESIKDFFKGVDVLLVDDIQFLAEKVKTQEMFFYIFSDLVKAGKQIVITSDRQPNELKGLEERLVTRFNQGLVVSIRNPDKDSCIEILKTKIQEAGLDVDTFDESVLYFVADRFSSNIRELEGALNRLIFYAVNIKKDEHVTMEVAMDALQSLSGGRSLMNTINEQKIIDIVADYYKLSPAQLTGRVRTGQIALARHIAMYLIRSLITDVSLKKIGDMFGGKDHTTVINGVERVEKGLKTDAVLKQAVDELTRRIKG
ncbi:MAG: chromosomal replication initiator protein DnaA [Coprobacillus sp.]|nr:chromosomal replication initiator protein DnaA [Coprobacillus sp.]